MNESTRLERVLRNWDGRATVVALAVALAAMPALAQTTKDGKGGRAKAVSVSGKVVDDKGKPVKDAEVGIDWRGDDKKVGVDAPLKTDKNGKFAGDFLIEPKQPAVFMAMDKTRKQGGWAVTADDKLDRLEIVMMPMTSVVGTFDLARLKTQPETVEIIVQTSPDKLDVVRYELPAKRKFAFRLPAGDYEVSLQCEGGDREAKLVNIAKGRAQYDLDKMSLRPTQPKKKPGGDEEAKGGQGAKKPTESAGKAPPALTVTEARGVKKDVKLADYKGKWVLLDFWGVWCPPCVGRSIPALLDFEEKHKADKDRYAILTVHCGGGRVEETLAAMDAKLPDLEKNLWKRKFPFPVVVDATRKTVKDWGVNSYPTQCLIDPSGSLVMQQNSGVEERLADELKKSAAKGESGKGGDDAGEPKKKAPK